jgi:Ca2+-binding EF-hand superfamily protein
MPIKVLISWSRYMRSIGCLISQTLTVSSQRNPTRVHSSTLNQSFDSPTGDGELEYDEFVERILKRPSQPHVDVRHWKRQLQLALAEDGEGKTLRAVFGEWDRSGTKRLSMNELKRGMLALPVFKRLKLRETDVEAMFMQADTRQDGYITREQFVNYFSGEREGMTLSAHLPPAVLLQQNKPWAVSSSHAVEAAVKSAAREGRLEYTVLTIDPMQRIRDRLFEKRVTATEAFRAFDADRDGFVSRDDFIAGCTGSSHTVFNSLKDMKDLGLSGLVCSSLFDAIDGSSRGFVDLPAWQRALTEPPVKRGYEAGVVAAVHDLLDTGRFSVDTLFAEWNASKDGRLTTAQFCSGCRRARVQVPLAHLVELFRQMDTQDRGSISLPAFKQRFAFPVPPWDWEERAADSLGRMLFEATGAQTVGEIGRTLVQQTRRAAQRYLTLDSFQLAVEGVVGTDRLSSLRLRPQQWPALFGFLDTGHAAGTSGDGQLGEDDLERWLGHLAPVPRILAEIGVRRHTPVKKTNK